LETIAQKAMQQIHSSKYVTVLEENQKKELMFVGVAFDGKEVACVIEKS
ncbi:hypothetical protein HHU12_32355, partial [Flammeovirga aprica JL-4]|nr:hypothetical protein [Flammeovirga aprica JL-4]